MGDACGVTKPTIRNWMEKHDIRRRDRSECQGVSKDSPLRDPEWLRKQYWKKRRDAYDIAESLGVGEGAVRNWMDEHGIERRGQKAAQGVNPNNPIYDAEWVREKYEAGWSTPEIAKECGIGVPTAHRWRNRHGIEAREYPMTPPDSPVRDAEWLRKQYRDKWRSPQKIAQDLDVCTRTVWLWLKRHGIETRDNSEYEAERHWRYGEGEAVPRYRGPNWEKQRERARFRDQYRCQNCGVTQPEHLADFGRGLSVHHLTPIRVFRENSDDGPNWDRVNALDNLLTLCQPCHQSIYEPMAPLRPQSIETAN